MAFVHRFAALVSFVPIATSLILEQGSSSKGGPSPDGYFWTKRKGDDGSSSVPYTVPSDLSRAPAWVWNNSLDEQIRHSPLIDDKKNIYVMSTQRLRKFSQDGKILWLKYFKQCKMTASPALWKGSIYLLCPLSSGGVRHVSVLSLSMDSGDLLWNQTDRGAVGGDSQSLLVHDGTLVIPMDVHVDLPMDKEARTNMWSAMNASNGKHLWDYAADEVMWNAVPDTPGDGTLLFGHSCGGASRITFGGKLLWKVGPHAGQDTMCSTGGGTPGPNGVFYTEYTKKDGSAHVSAYQVSDGSLLWERNFGTEYAGGQYPAVGRLGTDGPLAVVVAIGGNPGFAPWMYPGGEIFWNPDALHAYLTNATVRKSIPTPNFKNAVVAMDAATGEVIWRWEEAIWDHIGAAGDEGEEAQRREREHSPENSICLPDLQGVPVITGDGTVYASSSHGGDLTAIRGDANGNGIIDASEVSTLATHKAFLNSPSVAPGLLVAAPCWGPMYVFKD